MMNLKKRKSHVWPLPGWRSEQVLSVLLITLLGLSFFLYADEKVLYETDSKYNHIIVTEDGDGVRTLLFEKNGAMQSAGKPDDPDCLILEYVRSAMVSLAFVEKPERILIIGLGGGSMPRFLRKHYPAMTIDVVDIDPEIVKVAKRFFGFREDAKLKAHVTDGRKFIEQCKKPYDIILLDAYGPEDVPYLLTTKEFLLAVRSALRPSGVVAANLWGGDSNLQFQAMLKTYQQAFPAVFKFKVPLCDNEIVVAMPKSKTTPFKTFLARARAITRDKAFPFDLEEFFLFDFDDITFDSIKAKVLLDADAPKAKQ